MQLKSMFKRETPFPLLPCILAADHRKHAKPLRHVMYSSKVTYVAPVCSAAHAQALSTKEPVWTWAITLRSGGSADGVRSQFCGLRRKRVIAGARWRVAEIVSVSEATARSQKRSVCCSLIWTVGQVPHHRCLAVLHPEANYPKAALSVLVAALVIR